MSFRPPLAPLAAALLAAACGSSAPGDRPSDGDGDGGFAPVADASGSGGATDAAPTRIDAAVPCSIEALPDFGVHPGYELFGGYNPPSMEWHIFYDVVETDSDGDGYGDYLGGVYLRKGRGLFSGGIEVGKYEITGAEARADSCAICVWAQSRTGVIPDDLYRFHARSGTVYIDEIDEETETLRGRVLDAELVAYDVGYGGGAPCVSNDGSCGMTWCSGDNTCAAQEPRPEICSFSIGELNFEARPPN